MEQTATINDVMSLIEAHVEGLGLKSTSALYAALAKAQAECRGVEKGSYNKHHGYKYASSEDVMATATEALGNHGLAFICVKAETMADAKERGRGMCSAMLLTEYLIVHEGGGTLTLKSQTPIHEGKGRPFDKAVATAKTYDQSYTLRGLLNLPRVEEGMERDAQDDEQIAAHNRELKAARDAEEKARREAHAQARKILNAKKLRIRDISEDFFEASGVPRSNVAISKFIQWAAEESKAPASMEEDSEYCDSAIQYLVNWRTETEADALGEAQRFRAECYPDTDEEKARADAAFDAYEEAKAKAAESVKGGE